MTQPKLKTHRRPSAHAREVGVVHHMARSWALPSSLEPDIRAGVERRMKVEIGRAARAAGMRLISEIRIVEDLDDDLETVLYARAVADYDERGNPYSSEPRGRVLNWVRDTAYQLMMAPGYSGGGMKLTPMPGGGWGQPEPVPTVLWAHEETHRALAEDLDLTVYGRQPLEVAGMRFAIAPHQDIDTDELRASSRWDGSSRVGETTTRVSLLVPHDLTGQDAATYRTLRENGLRAADARAMLAPVLAPAAAS